MALKNTALDSSSKNRQQREKTSYLDSLLQFIADSPTPFHASRNLSVKLEAAGFERLNETENWRLDPNGKYYVTRNDTSLCAFRYGADKDQQTGLRLVGAHLDSPCLKLNPNPVYTKFGYESINVEVYGSALVRTWFDRELSVAGRVYYLDRDSKPKSCFIDLKEPIAIIPSIAIHLEREANVKQAIDTQIHLNPLCSLEINTKAKEESVLYQKLLQILEDADTSLRTEAILGFDLSLYDVNPPQRFGRSHDELIASARIDNLLSCFAAAHSMLHSNDDRFCGLICSDHEEVGSVSDTGAQGSFLEAVLTRAIPQYDSRVIRRSMLISADGAHGIHPNYPNKHDHEHAPRINRGPVIKVNSNQRYATTGESISFIKYLCRKNEIPYQVFVSRNNIPCGTTIGPIVASEIGIKTVDIGVAQFAMHSIRETTGANDAYDFMKLLTAFYESDLSMFATN